MGWPTPQDYNEAIQNPRICFSDPELKQGNPALTPLGLPKVISGAFASVYRLDCPSRRWAVRCFLREYADQQQRYSAISDRLRAIRLPCMVGFEFLREGIRVAGRWYPILKMEWIDGEPLNDYIARNLKQPESLRSLSRRWIDLMASLRKAEVAHGDLQHGNVLVSGGDLKLIDYDAMYVPALKGLESHEEGHRNYQHPGRTGKDYHADIDNFSAWVILTAVSALAIDPGLWKLPNAGDECLLFRREDFEKPSHSKVLQALESSGNAALRKLATDFRSVLGKPISLVPTLEAEKKKASIEDWWKSHPETRSNPTPPQNPPMLPEEEEEVASCVSPADFSRWWEEPPIVVRPLDPPVIEVGLRDRIALWVSMILLTTVLASWAFSLVSTLVAALITVVVVAAGGTVIIIDYNRVNPGIRAALRRRQRGLETAIAQIEQAIDLAGWERARLSEPLLKYQNELGALSGDIGDKTKGLERELANRLDRIDQRRRRARADFEMAIKRMEGEFESLDHKLASDISDIEKRKVVALEDQESSLKKLEVEVGQLNRDCAKRVEALQARKRQVLTERQAAERQSGDRLQATVRALIQKRDSLDKEKENALAKAVKLTEERHVRKFLSSRKIEDALIDGIGPKLKERLYQARITTAFDVFYSHARDVAGIGEAKANALVAWRRRMEQQAYSTVSHSLYQAEVAEIHRKYKALRSSLDEQIAKEEQQAREAGRNRSAIFDSMLRAVATEEADTRKEFEAQTLTLRERQERERARINASYAAALKSLESEEATARRDHSFA